MSTRHTNIPELFAKNVMSALRHDHPDREVKAVKAAIEQSLRKDNRRLNEAVYYYALCERAWLHWSRQALDFITIHALQQATNGACNPPEVRTAQDAAAAQSRCGLHLQLLDVASEGLETSDSPWQIEAARHVTTATQQALGVAAKLNPHQPTAAREVLGGIAHAADALAAAIHGGFVTDAPGEVRETMLAMMHRRGRDSS